MFVTGSAALDAVVADPAALRRSRGRRPWPMIVLRSPQAEPDRPLWTESRARAPGVPTGCRSRMGARIPSTSVRWRPGCGRTGPKSCSTNEAAPRVLSVADAGADLPVDIAPSGLSNLRDRAESVGGTFTFDSYPGRGVRVQWLRRCLESGVSQRSGGRARGQTAHGPGRDDHDRAARIAHGVARNAAEQQFRRAAGAACADDEEIGVGGRGDQLRGRIAPRRRE